MLLSGRGKNMTLSTVVLAGLFVFSIDLSEGEVTLVFETAAPSGDNLWTWTYWGHAR